MKIKIKRRRGQIQAGKNISVVEADANTIISADDPPPGSGTEGDPISVVGSDGKLNTVPKHSTWSSPSAYPTELRAVNTGRTMRLDVDGLSVEGAAADFLHDPVTGIGGGYKGSRKIEVDLSSAPAFDIAVTAAGGLVLTHIASGRTLTLAADATSIRATKADGDFGSLYNTGFEAQETSSGNAVGLDANSGNGLAIDIDGVQITANDNGLIISNGTNNLTIDPALITANMSVREIDVCDAGVTKQMLIVGSAPY